MLTGGGEGKEGEELDGVGESGITGIGSWVSGYGVVGGYGTDSNMYRSCRWHHTGRIYKAHYQ